MLNKNKLFEKFIEKCHITHGNRYDYSLVNYVNKDTKVEIICKEHGVFEQRPANHTNSKQGCPSCSGLKRMSSEDFISKAKKIHGNKYDYSKVNYTNNKTKVKIICRNHGYFYQKPNNHLNGQDCKKCVNLNVKSNSVDFIKKSIDRFGEYYDYSKVYYKNNKTKVRLICPKHGEFMQKPDNHFNTKTPCKKCDSEKRLADVEILIKKLKEIHNNYYDYSKLKYNGMSKSGTIICPEHGEFNQTIHTHIMGSGCKKCSHSAGEKLIADILNLNNLYFIPEYKFPNCKYKSHLKFDFYIPSKNLCIEFNGLQHYIPIKFFGGESSFNSMKIRDRIKEDYCKSNNIRLLTIKYDTDKKEIMSMIKSYLL